MPLQSKKPLARRTPLKSSTPLKRGAFKSKPATRASGLKRRVKPWDRAKYREEAVELAKRIVRTRMCRCERCGKTTGLQGSHIYSVGAHRDMAAMTDNILCLCERCHIFWWHREVIEAALWFEENYPVRAKRLRLRSQRTEKQDWELTYRLLKVEYEGL